jgi:HEPN domain-containing protein
MDVHKVVRYWLDTADKDWDVARNLFKFKHYAYCLFFCHLTIEKLLKAAAVQKTGKHPPPIHELKKLAKLAVLKLTPLQRERLEEITTFNIQARYDDFKQSFYKKATREYTQKFLTITKELRLWLKENFHSTRP